MRLLDGGFDAVTWTRGRGSAAAAASTPLSLRVATPHQRKFPEALVSHQDTHTRWRGSRLRTR